MENKWIGSAQKCSVFVVPLLGRVRLATVAINVSIRPKLRGLIYRLLLMKKAGAHFVVRAHKGNSVRESSKKLDPNWTPEIR